MIISKVTMARPKRAQPDRVFGLTLIVSERTNKRHHHHLQGEVVNDEGLRGNLVFEPSKRCFFLSRGMPTLLLHEP
jgi:hypothetical protein